jgi:AcrR family transcriptional regulator
MRGLADHLGVSPMALYNHVSSKKDLVQGLAEHLVNQVNFSHDGLDWQDRIRACFRRLRDACLAHPSAIRLMEAVEVAPVSVFRPMEITLAALDEAGIGPTDAVKGYCLLIGFTVGQVSYEIRGPFQSFDAGEALRRRRITGADFSHIERSVSLEGWDFTSSFEFGLSVILTGLQELALKK